MIPVAEPWIAGKELEYVADCLKSGWISSLGKYIPQFEEEFSRYCGMEYGIATSNGTTALHLALATLGIGPADEVILPTLTFIATANCVTYTGARPIFVDSELATWNMDPAQVEEKITPRTKAIIVVHLYGHPTDMDPILGIARRHGLYVIEDAAEAHGARYKGQRVGGLGDISCFSFYGNKIITTGEGGILLTRNGEWAARAQQLRDHAMSPVKRYWHDDIGYNYRMTNVQAAIGVAQMERIDEFIAKKRQIAQWYSQRLSIPGLTLAPQATWASSVYWMYSVLVDESQRRTSRDELACALREQEIDSRPFFWPLHLLPPYRRDVGAFPVAEQLGREGINLPSGVTLTEQQIEKIAQVILRTMA